MTDKQRANHVQAKYWNGFITRTEAQQVFDQQAQVIQAQAAAIQKLDTVLTFISKEKLGVTIEDVNAWVAKMVEEAKKATETQPDGSADENGASQQQEPSSLISAA